jgi:hypothetical protein
LPVSNFDIATDLFIYAPVPPDGTFIIGYSLLGGPDLLGEYDTFILEPGSGFLRPDLVVVGQKIECEVSSLQTTRGFAVEESVYFQAESQSAQITLRASWLNPVTQGALRLGKPIVIAHNQNGSSYPKQMFLGWITNIDVDFQPDNMALVNLTLYDALQFLSTIPGQLIQNSTMPPGTKGLDANLNYLLDGIPMPYSPVLGIITDRTNSSLFWTTVEPYVFDPSIGILETLNAFMLSELGALWADNKISLTTAKPFNHVGIMTAGNDDIVATLAGAPEYVITNDHTIEDHYCLGPIEWSAEIDRQIKSAKASTSSPNPNLIVVNQTNSYLNIGKDLRLTTVNSGSGGTSTVDLLNEWGSRIALTNTDPVPTSVEVKGIDDFGTLLDIVDAEPAQSARIKFVQESGTIDQTYLINKITNTVTADGWLVNLELWRN